MIPSKQPKTPGASEKVTVPHNFFSKNSVSIHGCISCRKCGNGCPLCHPDRHESCKPGSIRKITGTPFRSTHAEIDAHWEQAIERVKKVGGVASFYMVAGYLRAWGDEKKLLDWHLARRSK